MAKLRIWLAALPVCWGLPGYRSPNSPMSLCFDGVSFSKPERSPMSGQPIATQAPSRMSDHRFLACSPSVVPTRQ